VGDPDRVKEVSKHFDQIEHRSQHREFITHTGFIGKKRLTVLSSGIGPDNIDIVLNELDALVNIDLRERMVRSELRSLNILRMGTSGSLQKDIPVDSLVASTHGLGIDNLLNFYAHPQTSEDTLMLQAFLNQTQFHPDLSRPYVSPCSTVLLKNFVDGFHHGITVTCPGFYGPQGRVLRIGLRQPDLIDRLTDFRYGNSRITNFEMETSAIYGLGRILGHQCLSLNTIVANRVMKNFSANGKAAVENLIVKGLGIISTIGS
jgi:uridine phosphorylase